ncbi:MAG TPA: hypothetical protein VE503_08050, partial [Ornithinibacter sp.]|nr:hypothetical protein [Ornithinibacter sp.]
MFAQLKGVRTRQGGPRRGVAELRSRGFWVTFWVRQQNVNKEMGGPGASYDLCYRVRRREEVFTARRRK